MRSSEGTAWRMPSPRQLHNQFSLALWRWSWFLFLTLLPIVVFGNGFEVVERKASPRHSGATEARPITLRIPDPSFMGFLPLYVADEKGYFREFGINVLWEYVRDPGHAAKLFFADQADLLITTFANLLPAEVRQPGTLKLLLPIYESSKDPGSYILVRNDSEIKTVQGLRGKTLGTYSGPSQKAYALIVLRNLGFKEPDDIRLVQVGTAAQVQGLFGGSYDALFTVEPYASLAISVGARIVERGVRTKYISDPFWIGSAAVHPYLLQKNRGAIPALLGALGKAVDFIHANDKEAREILAKRTQIDLDVAIRSALYTWVINPNASDVAQIQQHMDLLVREGLMEKPVNVKAIMLPAPGK